MATFSCACLPNAHSLSAPPTPSWLTTVLVAGSISMTQPISWYPSPFTSTSVTASSQTITVLRGVTVPEQNLDVVPISETGKFTFPPAVISQVLVVLLKETDKMEHSAGVVSLLIDR